MDMDKEKLIKKEVKRLSAIYQNISEDKKKTIQGLIERAAFMRVSLDEMEKDLNENGFTEWFSQGDQEPYQRKRPVADLYNSMNTAYQKITKQLTDLLPKDDARAVEEDDGFDGFVRGRR